MKEKKNKKETGSLKITFKATPSQSSRTVGGYPVLKFKKKMIFDILPFRKDNEWYYSSDVYSSFNPFKISRSYFEGCTWRKMYWVLYEGKICLLRCSFYKGFGQLLNDAIQKNSKAFCVPGGKSIKLRCRDSIYNGKPFVEPIEVRLIERKEEIDPKICLKLEDPYPLYKKETEGLSKSKVGKKEKKNKKEKR